MSKEKVAQEIYKTTLLEDNKYHKLKMELQDLKERIERTEKAEKMRRRIQ